MKKNSIAAILLAGMLGSLTGCGKPLLSTGDPIKAEQLGLQIQSANPEGKAPDEAFLAAQTAFSLSLLQQTLAEQKNAAGNVLVSPRSVMLALAMTANGADGETLTGMETALGGLPVAELNPYLLTQQEQPADKGAKLTTANSVWVKEGLKVLDPFLQKTRDYYNAAIYRAPFDSSTVQDINSWCESNTDGMIPKLIDDLGVNAVMYLINAAAFDAKWMKPYEPQEIHENALFHPTPTQKTPVTMMNSEESTYLQGEGASGFLRYYEGGKYAFAALLPDEGTTAAEYAASLTPEALRSILQNRETCTVHTGIPVFSFDFDTDLKQPLSEMGMEGAFQEGADFSAMAESGGLFINRVLHKTHIAVDTEGTRAAALTAVEMAENGALLEEDAKYVILDRPFLFMILDTETNLPVFFGLLNTP